MNEAAKWGLEFAGDVRVDRVVEAGAEIEVGSYRVHTVEARGHAVDGLGYVIEEEGLFAVGDYLMRSQYPMVWWSLREARRSTERLLEAIDRFDLRLVVPGHGPLLSVDEARTVGEEDLAYFAAVEEAADQAHRDGRPAARMAPRGPERAAAAAGGSRHRAALPAPPQRGRDLPRPRRGRPPAVAHRHGLSPAARYSCSVPHAAVPCSSTMPVSAPASDATWSWVSRTCEMRPKRGQRTLIVTAS